MFKTVKNRLASFKQDENGAVTVDWVVLTAAAIGISLTALFTVGGGVKAWATYINENLEASAQTDP